MVKYEMRYRTYPTRDDIEWGEFTEFTEWKHWSPIVEGREKAPELLGILDYEGVGIVSLVKNIGEGYVMETQYRKVQ